MAARCRQARACGRVNDRSNSVSKSRCRYILAAPALSFLLDQRMNVSANLVRMKTFSCIGMTAAERRPASLAIM
jgi:hypothetical protein